jgi:chitin-binding protein
MKIKRLVGSGTAFAVLGTLAIGTAPAAWSHGYVGGEESGLVARAAMKDNVGLGNVQYEPQSIEGRKGFPAAGPVDGQLASGGNERFAELDEQSADRWVKNEITPGLNTISWHYTAMHPTTKWEYFMTTAGWDPEQPLARSSLELIETVLHDGTLPNRTEAHTIDVPEDRSGYHVIYAVWTVDDTANAFYNVIDVDVAGDPVEAGDPPVLAGVPAATSVGSDHVTLEWPPATSEAGVAGYEVYRDGVAIGRTSATTLTDRAVSPETTYSYTVRAYDRAGQLSAHSTPVEVTTPDGPVALAPPSNVHSMGATTSTIDLMWGAAQGGTGDVTYEISRATLGSDFGTVGETTSTRFMDTGLAPGTTYQYVITARDASGATAGSASVQIATHPDPSAPPAWDPFGIYRIGDRVTHEGLLYEAISDYTGQGDENWIFAPSLWVQIPWPEEEITPQPAGQPVLSLVGDQDAVRLQVAVPAEAYDTLDRFIVRHNGQYVMELHGGRTFYGSTDRSVEDSVVSHRAVEALAGDTVELWRTPGAPGQSSAGGTVVQTEVVPADIGAPASAIEAVQGITTDGGRVTVALDATQFAAENRYIVRVDGQYVFETYAGTAYYSQRTISGATVQVSRDVAVGSGSTVTVTLASGTPGQSAATAPREIATHVVG